MPPQIFTFEAVTAAIEKISPLAVVKAMADGFRLYSAGRVSVAPIQTLGQPPLANFVGHPDAQAGIKAAYENGGDYCVSKVASGGGKSRPRGDVSSAICGASADGGGPTGGG